jgi:hypothetical protein
VLLPSIRRLTLADLTDEALHELITHGESLYVDRKRKPPPSPKFGAAVAAFANTLGGWILLGVDDDGSVVGWDRPPQLDVQSHLASLLRAQVDPLPPFVAAVREVDGREIAVMRVFESSDAPHIVRGTGAVYLRSSKGKEPVAVDDHRMLLELARRGDDAEARAQTRIGDLQAVRNMLSIDGDGATLRVAGCCRWIAWAAPVTVTPGFAAWSLSRRGADWCRERVLSLLPGARAPFGRDEPWIEPYGRGVVARVRASGAGFADERTAAILDARGLVAFELRRKAPTMALAGSLDEDVRPLARALADALVDAEAYGRAVVGLRFALATDGRLLGQVRDDCSPVVQVQREVTIPADEDEVEQLAQAWYRELQRSFGIEAFEG